MCLAWKLATAKKKASGVIATKPDAGKEGAFHRDQYEPGDSIATDQFFVKTPERLQKGNLLAKRHPVIPTKFKSTPNLKRS